jgi:uncharacterized protein GlcG (DUF336 family)
VPLTLEEAQTVIAAAIEKARQSGVRVAVAVVDEGGLLIALARMDGVLPLAIQVTEAKASASALWHRDGDELAVTGRDRPLILQQMNALPMLRQLPLIPALGSLVIRRNGQVLGAVGVSGGKADIDKICAQAGLEAVAGLDGPRG